MRSILPQELQQRIAAGKSVCLLDVRTAGEYASAHIAQATLKPLNGFDAAAFAKQPDAAGEVYVICQSGARARSAVKQLELAGVSDCVLVDGGMSAWVNAGLPVERQGKGVISLERQVRIAAGLFVFSGTLLGALVHPALLVVPGIVGAGLMFAGISDICGMGMLLARMPWNQANRAMSANVCCQAKS
jgi:rhodanese-related sulfurtransferase